MTSTLLMYRKELPPMPASAGIKASTLGKRFSPAAYSSLTHIEENKA